MNAIIRYKKCFSCKTRLKAELIATIKNKKNNASVNLCPGCWFHWQNPNAAMEIDNAIYGAE